MYKLKSAKGRSTLNKISFYDFLHYIMFMTISFITLMQKINKTTTTTTFPCSQKIPKFLIKVNALFPQDVMSFLFFNKQENKISCK